jgi:hypothetical protein
MKVPVKVRRITGVPLCVVCKQHNLSAGRGLSITNGVHICMDCAIGIHNIVEDVFETHIPDEEACALHEPAGRKEST